MLLTGWGPGGVFVETLTEADHVFVEILITKDCVLVGLITK